MSITIDQRQRLADVQQRVSELRKQRKQLEDFKGAARAAVPDGAVDTSSEEFRRLQRVSRDLDDVEKSIALVEEEHRFVLSQIAGVGHVATGQDSWLHNPDVLQNLASLAHSELPVGNLNLGPVLSRDELLADFEQRKQMMATGGDVTLPSDQARTRFYGVIPQLRRQLRLLDLNPVQPMDVGSFSYLIEGGSFAGAAETSELTTKPSGTLTLTDATVTARTIPEWLRISRPTLADVPGLETIIRNRLQFSVESRLESQILSGDGTGQNFTGILNTSGIGAPASGAGDTVNSDLVATGIATVRQGNAEPNGIAMNPLDVVKAHKVKASGSGERLDSDGAFGAQPTSMWGLPLIQTVAIAAGTALVGDFQRGAPSATRRMACQL